MLVVLGFVGHPLAEFFFELVPANLFLLLSGTAVHVLDDRVGHPVHELLRTLLSLLHLVQTVLLLLVQHASVFFLGTDVFETFSLTLSKGLSFVLLVFSQHLLEILFLLLSLFLLKTTFGIHFFLKTFDKSDLLSVSLFLFDLAAELVLIELFVPGLFLQHYASLEFSSLLELLLLKQLDMLVLKILVHELLLDLGLLPGVLLLQLLVQLLLDQALSLAITQDRLLLLLVVEKGVELLDGCPLILLLDLGVGLGFGALGTRSPALGVERLIFSDGCFFSSGSRKTRSAGYVRAGNRLGL